MYLIHVVLPYFCRVRASCQLFDWLRHITAYPYTCGVVSGKATEPAILLIVCCSCFAGARHAIIQISATSGSWFHNICHDICHHTWCCLCIYDGVLLRWCIYDIVVRIHNRLYTGRIPVHSIVLKCWICRCHLQCGYTCCKTSKCCCCDIVILYDIGKIHILEIL